MSTKVFLGVDGGSQEHVCVARRDDEEVLWEARISNDHAGCSRVLEEVKRWQELEYEVWIGAEGHGGYLSPLDVRLCAAGCRYVSMHPTQVSRFRETVQVQPDKDDWIDARLLSEMLGWMVSRGKAEVYDAGDEYFTHLRSASRSFEASTEAKVSAQSQLVNKVRVYWPELVAPDRYFADTDAAGLLALLSRYPTPQAVSEAGLTAVRRVLTRASGRDQSDLAKRIVKDARALVPVAKISGAGDGMVRLLAESVIRSIENVRVMERALEDLLEQHPFGKWMLEQRGIGVRTAGCFLGEAGNLDRFKTESKLARYAGNGCAKFKTGKSKERHWDAHRYNHRLKRAVLLMAESRSRWHEESIIFVRTRKEEGTEHWKAVKKLARHLIRRLWKNWQEIVNSPDETTVEWGAKAA